MNDFQLHGSNSDPFQHSGLQYERSVGFLQQNDLVGGTQAHITTKLSFVPACVLSHASILSASRPGLRLLEATCPGGLGPSPRCLCGLSHSGWRPSLSLVVGSLHLRSPALPRRVSPALTGPSTPLPSPVTWQETCYCLLVLG